MGDQIIFITPPKRKSMLAALLLTFLFGPFGLLYISLTGAGLMLLFMLLLALPALLFHALLILPWLGSMLWAALAVDRANR